MRKMIIAAVTLLALGCGSQDILGPASPDFAEQCTVYVNGDGTPTSVPQATWAHCTQVMIEVVNYQACK